MKQNGVVTIIDGEIIYWQSKEEALKKINSNCLWHLFGDVSSLLIVEEQLVSGKKICTDTDYDMFTMIKANMALKLGYYV